MSNYHSKLSVSLHPRIVFEAISKEMSQWWTEMSAPITRIGDTTTARFEDGTTWSFKAVSIVQDQLIELHCYHANHIHHVTTPNMRSEWAGTSLRFELHKAGTATEITFTHIGLTPELSCYEICHSGWDHFFGSAFKMYLANKEDR